MPHRSWGQPKEEITMRKTLMAALGTTGALLLAAPAWAGGGHGHGHGHGHWKHGHGHGHGHHARAHHFHTHRHTVVRHYYRPAPVYAAPVYAAPVYSAPAPGVHVVLPNIF